MMFDLACAEIRVPAFAGISTRIVPEGRVSRQDSNVTPHGAPAIVATLVTQCFGIEMRLRGRMNHPDPVETETVTAKATLSLPDSGPYPYTIEITWRKTTRRFNFTIDFASGRVSLTTDNHAPSATAVAGVTAPVAGSPAASTT